MTTFFWCRYRIADALRCAGPFATLEEAGQFGKLIAKMDERDVPRLVDYVETAGDPATLEEEQW